MARILASLALMSALVAGGDARAQDRLLPFARLADDTESYRVELSAEGRPVALRGERDSVRVPQSVIPLAIMRNPEGGRTLVGRADVDGRLTVHVAPAGRAFAAGVPVAVTDAMALYPQAAFIEHGRLFVLAYDVVSNVPAGRKLTGLAEGLDLVEIATDSGAVTRHARALDIGGIDVTVLPLRRSGERVLCTQSKCLTVRVAGPRGAVTTTVATPPRAFDAGQIILEAAADDRSTWLLVRRDADDRFAPIVETATSYALCPLSGGACRPTPEAKIPYALSVTAGEPVLRLADEPHEYEEVLLHDLFRLRWGGLAHYGENNLEGRMPWSQAYYLAGLAALLERPALSSHLSATTRNDVRARLCYETRRMAAFSAAGGVWFISRRYSLNREDLPSTVHLGRIHRVLSRARALGCPGLDAAMADIANELIEPRRVGERIVQREGAAPLLTFSKGIPFWADGVNTPWNYQSAWIEAVSAGGLTQRSQLMRDTARSMIQDFVTTERLQSAPTLWNYGAGRFAKGWTSADGISVNTPAWIGDHKASTPTAHTSYRSMDALALGHADGAGLTPMSAQMRSYLVEQVRSGRLLPYVLEALTPASETPQLDSRIRQLHARAVLPWHIQPQVWALGSQ